MKKFLNDLNSFSHQILFYANRGLLRIDFMQEIAKMLLDFSGCDVVELWVKKENDQNRLEIAKISKKSFQFEVKTFIHSDNSFELDFLFNEIFCGHYELTSPFFTDNGSFWTGNIDSPCVISIKTDTHVYNKEISFHGEHKSLALIPLKVGGENIGLLHLKSKRSDYFSEDDIKRCEKIVPALGIALMSQRAQAALQERIKELTCLYGIAKVAEQFDSSLDEIFQTIVNLLPPAWQYPEITCGRIVFDGRSFSTPNFQETSQKQMANIVVAGKKRGFVEVVYLEAMPELDEGPFLREERSLIDTIAKQIALIVERKQAAEDRLKLQEQLRHADRLATIGQLAAGVAHEINEPLGNILGFAQLAQKCPGLPKQAEQDLNKIIAASLQAREVIKKLMLFARQKQPEKKKVNLNDVIKEGLSFLESRCAKEGIELVRLLSSDIPEIIADPSQLYQVLVNLVVNALQAMPDGGKIIIRTIADENHVSMIVEDTGIGMSDEIKKQMFIPFFTTKDVGQGTGIGLSVVHGIVTSHGGSIKVESEVGKGTRFEIKLPVKENQTIR